MQEIKRKLVRRKRRHLRLRKRVIGTCARPRLSVNRTLKNIFCQLINDIDGKTLASASSLLKEIKDKQPYGGNKKAAELVGEKIAEDAVKLGVKDVVFDRSGYKYHGRIQSLAESAKKNGLNF